MLQFDLLWCYALRLGRVTVKLLIISLHLFRGASVAKWLRCLALKLLAPLRWGSNPMRGSCQLLMEGYWFTPSNDLFLQLWRLTAIYNQTWLNNGVKHQFTSPHFTHLFSLLKMRFFAYLVAYVIGKVI